jgi:hypothetical protein
MISGHGDDEADVLVIRVWRESDADEPFRARITYGSDQQTAASDPHAVVELVRRWLAERAGVAEAPR